MAAVPGAGLKVKHETFKPSYDISPVSGYSPALSAGDFRFVPGQTGEARKDGEGPLDPEVRHPRALWRQWPIKLETDFIIKRKLTPCLEGAGASLDSVVEGASLSERPRRRAGLQRSLAVAFQERSAGDHDHRHDAIPASRINDLRIEINTISLADQGQDQARGHSRAASRRHLTAMSPQSNAAICCSCPA